MNQKFQVPGEIHLEAVTFSAPVPAAQSVGASLNILLCHGLPPSAKREPGDSGYLGWCEQVQGWGHTATTFDFRGCYNSGGDFSMSAWVDDISRVIDAVATDAPLVVVASSLGASAALVAAARDTRISAIATFAAPASLADLVSADPSGFLKRVRDIELISTDGFPEDFDAWVDEFLSAPILESAANLGDRRLLVLHGMADDVVPPAHAHQIATACPGSILLTFPDAGHRLRHDGRAQQALHDFLDLVARAYVNH